MHGRTYAIIMYYLKTEIAILELKLVHFLKLLWIISMKSWDLQVIDNACIKMWERVALTATCQYKSTLCGSYSIRQNPIKRLRVASCSILIHKLIKSPWCKNLSDCSIGKAPWGQGKLQPPAGKPQPGSYSPTCVFGVRSCKKNWDTVIIVTFSILVFSTT